MICECGHSDNVHSKMNDQEGTKKWIGQCNHKECKKGKCLKFKEK